MDNIKFINRSMQYRGEMIIDAFYGRLKYREKKAIKQ